MVGRRDVSSRKSDKRKALERMRSARQGSSAIESIDIQEDSVFEEVTEQEYADLVRERRAQGPFVEEDGEGIGYYDDGEEQFFEENDEMQQEEDQEDDKAKGQGALSRAYVKRAKRKQREKLGNMNASARVAAKYFTKGANASKANVFPSKRPKQGMSTGTLTPRRDPQMK